MSSVVGWVVNTVMPAMLAAGTPCVPSIVTTGSKIASASPFALVPSRTLCQSGAASAGCASASVTASVTTHVYAVFASSGLPGSGRTASTFGIRLSTFHLRPIGTGAPVVASAQKTESASVGAVRGDAGRLAGSMGPEKKKKIAVVVPKPSIRSSACSTDAVFMRMTSAPRPIEAPLFRSVPSPSPGRPWSK
jgi:hypothetical protein